MCSHSVWAGGRETSRSVKICSVSLTLCGCIPHYEHVVRNCISVIIYPALSTTQQCCSLTRLDALAAFKSDYSSWYTGIVAIYLHLKLISLVQTSLLSRSSLNVWSLRLHICRNLILLWLRVLIKPHKPCFLAFLPPLLFHQREMRHYKTTRTLQPNPWLHGVQE